MICNQYTTNIRVQETLDVLSLTYNQAQEDKDLLTSTDEPLEGSDNIAFVEDASFNEDAKTKVSALEFSSAIAYLSKIQEVASSNNSSSLFAFIYTLLSTIILGYGTKLLRLGADDKANLVRELSEKSRNDISRIEDQLAVKTYISTAIVAINSTTTSLQLLVSCVHTNFVGEPETLESVNISFMNNLSSMCNQLEKVDQKISEYSIPEMDITGITSALSNFEKLFVIYKNSSLPANINDMDVAESRASSVATLHKKICDRQKKINAKAK